MKMQKVYQDKLLDKIPEDLCLETLSQLRTEEAELTREMCINLIECIIVGDRPKDKSTPHNIQIYYKFLDNGLANGEKPKLK